MNLAVIQLRLSELRSELRSAEAALERKQEAAVLSLTGLYASTSGSLHILQDAVELQVLFDRRRMAREKVEEFETLIQHLKEA